MEEGQFERLLDDCDRELVEIVFEADVTEVVVAVLVLLVLLPVPIPDPTTRHRSKKFPKPRSTPKYILLGPWLPAVPGAQVGSDCVVVLAGEAVVLEAVVVVCVETPNRAVLEVEDIEVEREVPNEAVLLVLDAKPAVETIF